MLLCMLNCGSLCRRYGQRREVVRVRGVGGGTSTPQPLDPPRGSLEIPGASGSSVSRESAQRESTELLERHCQLLLLRMLNYGGPGRRCNQRREPVQVRGFGGGMSALQPLETPEAASGEPLGAFGNLFVASGSIWGVCVSFGGASGEPLEAWREL